MTSLDGRALRHRIAVVGFSASVLVVGACTVLAALLLFLGVLPTYAATAPAASFWFVLSLWGVLYLLVGAAYLAFLPREPGQEVLVGALHAQTPAPALFYASLEALVFVVRVAERLLWEEGAQLTEPWRTIAAIASSPDAFVGLASATLFLVVLGLVAGAWSWTQGSRPRRVSYTLWLVTAGALAVLPLVALPYV